MGAAAKGLDGLDTDIEGSLIAGSRIGGNRRIMAFESALGVVDNTTAIHVDGIEAVGLPNLVPVVVLQLLGGKGHLHIGHGEVVENGLQPNGVETVGGNIADEVVVALLKGIDTAVARKSRNEVAGRLTIRRNRKGNLCIFHCYFLISVVSLLKDTCKIIKFREKPTID